MDELGYRWDKAVKRKDLCDVFLPSNVLLTSIVTTYFGTFFDVHPSPLPRIVPPDSAFEM